MNDDLVERLQALLDDCGQDWCNCAEELAERRAEARLDEERE